jgi:iron complex transport system substrate-binding protein
MRFLAALGLRVPKKLGAVVGTKDSARISQEQLPLLDADVLIWQVSTAKQRAAIQADSVYRTLDVARQGRAIFFVGLDDPLYGALSFSTVLSVPYALDRLVPKLTAAVDRERTTKATMGG